MSSLTLQRLLAMPICPGNETRTRFEKIHILLHMPLEEVKKLIILYRDTRDPKLFDLLIIRFEFFLIKKLNYFKRRFSIFLHKEESQELMNISYIALNKALVSMKDTWRSDALLLRIGSYFKQELFNYYRISIKESKLNIGRIDSPEWIEESSSVCEGGDERLVKEVDMNLFLENIGKIRHKVKNFDLLEKRYIDGMKYKELSKLTGIKVVTLRIKVAKSLGDCRKYLKTINN